MITQPVFYLRFLHSAAGAPDADLYVNGHKLMSCACSGLTEYYKGYPGTYNIKAYPSGKLAGLMFDEDFHLEDGHMYTIAVKGDQYEIYVDFDNIEQMTS